MRCAVQEAMSCENDTPETQAGSQPSPVRCNDDRLRVPRLGFSKRSFEPRYISTIAAAAPPQSVLSSSEDLSAIRR